MSWRQDQLSWDLLLSFLPLSSAGEGRQAGDQQMGGNNSFKDGEFSSEPQNWSQGTARTVPQDLVQGCHHGDRVGHHHIHHCHSP